MATRFHNGQKTFLVHIVTCELMPYYRLSALGVFGVDGLLGAGEIPTGAKCSIERRGHTI